MPFQILFGDGWVIGTHINITVNSTPIIEELRLTSGGGPETTTFLVNTGDTVTVEFVDGLPESYAGEASYEVFNESGVSVVQESGAGSSNTDAGPEDSTFTVA